MRVAINGFGRIGRSVFRILEGVEGIDVVAINDSWVTAGPSLGSRRVVRMNAPRIAMAWDAPVSQYSAGNFRFVVERQFGYPVTPIRVDDLARADPSR